MAVMPLRFFSPTLNMNTGVTVVLPDPQPDAHAPGVLYLLHGAGDDETTWARMTSVERYASMYSLVVVMPSVNLSFYQDERYGAKYWSFVAEELPQVMHGYFRLSRDPAVTFVAGNSMGGYGAMKLALTFPERFGAAGCFSGAVDLYDAMARDIGALKSNAIRIFGCEDIPPASDLYQLMKRPAPRRPRLYAACGDGDFLYNEHQAFIPALEAAGWEVLRRDDHDMTHSWRYWDGLIRDFLAWAMI